MIFSGNLFAQTGTIKVTITGIDTKAGNSIKIALYDESGFLEEMKVSKTIKSKGNTTYFELKNIQVGKYAIALFQDENSDGKMNTTFYGKPTELIGFSNNAKDDFGPPDFNDASFDIIEGKSTRLIINLSK